MEDLEESINIHELEAIVSAAYERERRHNEFMAAIQGIDLNNDKQSAEERFAAAQRKAEAALTGKSEESLELDVFGLDIEEE